MKYLAITSALTAAIAASAASGATISLGDFDRILTEENRAFTVDGTDITGNAAITGNGDVVRHITDGFDPDFSYLLAGRTLADLSAGTNDKDKWVFENVTGTLQIDILNFAGSIAAPRGPYRTRFDVFVDGSSVENIQLIGNSGDNASVSFAELSVNDARVVIQARSNYGGADYDLGVRLAPVPVPASAALLAVGLFGFGTFARKKARKT